MGLRFNRSIRLFPGVRLNVGLGGASLSLGAPGASINIGKRGTYGNVGIPGTGLSYRQRLDSPERQPDEPIRCTISLAGDQIVVIADDGRPLGDDETKRILRENSSQIRDILDREAERRNGLVEPLMRPERSSGTSKSGKPIQRDGETRSDWLGRVGEWRAGNANNMEQRLVDSLESIDWGRETNIGCGISGNRAMLDIDLPEIEQVPMTVWKIAPRGQPPGLIEGRLSVSEGNRRYVRVVAAIARIATDAVMEGVPEVESLAVNAYTTRGGVDDYVVVLDVTRSQWEAIPADPDDEMILSRLGARMEITTTGRLKAQTPVAP